MPGRPTAGTGVEWRSYPVEGQEENAIVEQGLAVHSLQAVTDLASRLLVVSSRYCSEIFSDLFAFDLRGDPDNAAATCRQVHVLTSEHGVRYFSYR
jgi:hypothetical protein